MNAPLIAAPGFYPEVTCEQYFAEPCPAPALTNSGIKLLAPAGAAPAKFAAAHPAIGAPPEKAADTAVKRRGHLVHRIALGKGLEYVISPHDEYRTKEAKAWKAEAEETGVMPVKRKDFETATAMAGVIKGRIDEACQGRPYQTEVVIAWLEQMSQGTIWCRAMLDVWCPDLLLALDVKTCANADDEHLMRAFGGGYGTQFCFYRRGVEVLTAKHGRSRFKFLFVEEDAPHLSRAATPTEGLRHCAELEIRRAKAIFADCLSRGEWPGYQEAEVPPAPWMINRATAADLMAAE